MQNLSVSTMPPAVDEALTVEEAYAGVRADVFASIQTVGCAPEALRDVASALGWSAMMSPPSMWCRLDELRAVMCLLACWSK